LGLTVLLLSTASMCVQTLLDKISPRVSRADFKTNFGKDYLVLI